MQGIFQNAILISIVIILFSQCSTKTNDEFCDPGHGQTILQGRVVDFYTNEPIDSVQIDIVWNSSWDHLLDTLVKQNDSVSFVFNAPDECEPYFFTLSNKYYWTDPENHPAHKVSIDKGTINSFRISLKPATFFRINVSRDMHDTRSDTVLLQIRKANTDDWEQWADICMDDFRTSPSGDRLNRHVFSDSATQRTLSAYYDIESRFNYDVRWIRRDTKQIDTVTYQFRAEPFDTVQLYYRFEKQRLVNE